MSPLVRTAYRASVIPPGVDETDATCEIAQSVSIDVSEKGTTGRDKAIEVVSLPRCCHGE